MRPAPNSPASHLRAHWFLYLYEGAELAVFMMSACAFTVLLYGASSPIANPALRGLMMGIAMGITAILIIHSPMGKASGAHFNPAITLTYLRLGKIAPWDATFYIAGQFAGGILGVGLAKLALGQQLAAVHYAVTLPGKYGTGAAFAAEFFMGALLMGVVLVTSNRKSLARTTSYFVGTLIMFYILLFAPVSGFSINPARTVASAVFAHIWTALWIYFTAPLAGMLMSAELFIARFGIHRVFCAKLHHAPSYLCPNNTITTHD